MGLDFSVIWLGLLVVLLLIEAVTMGLTTIWFAGGALVAFLLSLFHVFWPVQMGAFLVVSLGLLIFTRPAAMRLMNRKIERTNVDSLLGEWALVTETIENIKGTGRVKLRGIDWTARTARDGQVIAADTVVYVRKVEGVKLIVDCVLDEKVEV